MPNTTNYDEDFYFGRLSSEQLLKNNNNCHHLWKSVEHCDDGYVECVYCKQIKDVRETKYVPLDII